MPNQQITLLNELIRLIFKIELIKITSSNELFAIVKLIHVFEQMHMVQNEAIIKENVFSIEKGDV